jgi:ABC-type glycerol-3-phosphate transport system substrate-binding protein
MKILFRLLTLTALLSVALAACAPAAPTAGPAATEPSSAAQPPAATDEPAATSAPAEKDVLKVWSFTNEINTMAIAYTCIHPETNVVVEYTVIPMTNGEYQTKLKAALGTADMPDVIALEAAFVKQYVESPDILADLGELLPLAEENKTYPFVTDVGTHDGVTKAFAYQATPGAVFYRRSLAKEYFGTDDPAEIQAMMSDLDKFTEMAAIVKEKSNGNTYMVGSSGEFQNPFYANRAEPWVVDDTLTVDPMAEKYIEIAKLFRDQGYEAQATQWQEGWFAGMNDSLVDAEGNPKQVFSYFLPTWGLPYVLAPNAKSADGAHDTSGDWGVVTGPLPYQWGGTWLGVVKDSPNQELAKDFVRFATLDQENLKNWATGVYTHDYLAQCDPNIPEDQAQAPGDFVSSQVVVDEIIPSFDDSELSAFLAGQNSYAGFAEAAPSVNAKLMQGSDDAIQRALNDPRDQYLNGEITLEEMWAAWKAAIAVEFPELTIPED